MKVFQLTRNEMSDLHADGTPTVRYVLLESQPYGGPTDQVYNIAVAIEDVKNLEALALGRVIADKGRTAGFWQNCGGHGVFRPRAAGTQGFSINLYAIIATQPEAEISFEGSTWEEILRSMPFSDEQKAMFVGIDEELKTVSTEKSSKRSGRKSRK